MEPIIDYERGGYGFSEYQTKYGSGVELYEMDSAGNPHLLQEVEGKTVDDIEEMTENEFGFFLAENGVL